MRTLGLNDDDLNALERIQGHGGMYPDKTSLTNISKLGIEADGQNFTLVVKHVCGIPYGGEWTKVIMAICSSDDSLNESTGGGTTLINVLPQPWHEAVIRNLRG